MKHFALLLFICFSQISISQNYFYLEDIKLKDKTDFTANEANAIKAIDYLTSSPINDKDFDRKACVRFILRYAEGSPFVSVSVESYVGDVYKKNLDILTMYIGLWVKSAINNKAGTKADHELFTMTEIYKYVAGGTANGVKLTKTINGLINAGNEGKIAEWIKKAKK
ncbi:hypothetical protein BH10BAC1_BH10BAC1_16410 [soil metagenome]